MAYRLFGYAVALALVAQTGFAAAADLKVLTTPALSEVWHDLAPKFEATGHKLTIVYAPSGAIAKRVTDGETADLLVSTPAGIDTLIKSGKVTDGTNVSIASSGMGVAVLKGAPKPDISTPEAFRRALLAAKAVAYTDPASGGASGMHMAKVLERLGIAAEVNARAKLGRGVPAGSFVVKGEADSRSSRCRSCWASPASRSSGRCPAICRTSRRLRPAFRQARRRPTRPKRWCVSCNRRTSAAAIKKHGLDPIPPAAPPKAS